jgi:hypothetical protein
MGSRGSEDEDMDMNPMHVQELVRDHEVELRASRRPARRPSAPRRHLAGMSRSGVQAVGVGLVRVGLRLAGPDTRERLSSPGRPGLAEFHS